MLQLLLGHARCVVPVTVRFALTVQIDGTYICTLALFLCVFIVQELCEGRRGRPGLSVLTSLLVSVDVKLY